MNILRKCIFRPYRKGCGPVFHLIMWDTYGRDDMGKSRLGYRLSSDGITLFEGEDFCCSPLHCVDSDDTVKGIMGFLTLKPGDTDREYFEGYTALQLEYCTKHAESLMCCVNDRYGWDD